MDEKPETVPIPNPNETDDVYNAQIESCIHYHVEHDRSIPIPLRCNKATLDLVNGMLDCKDCISKCCRESMTLGGKSEPIALTAEEFKRCRVTLNHNQQTALDAVAVKLTYEGIDCVNIPYPCAFYRKSEGCSVYKIRPVVCRLFPVGYVQSKEMGTLVGLNPRCPEVPAVARKLFTLWRKAALKEIPNVR